jgi:hypothetical protein
MKIAPGNFKNGPKKLQMIALDWRSQKVKAKPLK